MKYTKIPNTDIKVSKICLGSMTWGEQNTEAEGHEQLDYAFDNGVNFIDTAELYSIPGRKETQGNSERIIGTWLKNQKREELVIGSKITGPNPGLSYIREPQQYTKKLILETVENNLKRLQTDYIDVYQLHWPDRNVNFFGKLNYKHNPEEKWDDKIAEIVEAMNILIKEGKIRHYGLSNESPWGTMKHLNEADQKGLSRCKTMQNPYSLLNRSYEVGMAEVGMRENVGLLAYSPLAFGVLTGKYFNNNLPKGSRIEKFPNYNRYSNPQAMFLAEKFSELAQKHNLSLAELSLAFIEHQPFVTSTIIGATKMSQLKENIDTINIKLAKELLEEIDEVHKLQPNPAP
ncbi:aryl-alcohol dehydrogenase-like predicted oxidoreductase [Wenyingzhuangia heitensis]|uniref:Aryl-alcohol dehydrogenase-like predicted oxidoreductase n=1 Tax=Wenyingzhuangia heitensis TaxID=1487859 RepID=A0ABX0U533_9FLAO|nr:aldo/keto reductase [Wenyingzhuangia heitensis]NIJ43868.1 aryl-alcohol dehydrogenase-like predicted oxidoreductase [Wenyingzhuangia heitensis]